jgi:hypothetical protein
MDVSKWLETGLSILIKAYKLEVSHSPKLTHVLTCKLTALWFFILMNLICAPSNYVIHDVFKSISKTYLLEDQGDVHNYLGICIKKDPGNQTITML